MILRNGRGQARRRHNTTREVRRLRRVSEARRLAALVPSSSASSSRSPCSSARWLRKTRARRRSPSAVRWMCATRASTSEGSRAMRPTRSARLTSSVTVLWARQRRSARSVTVARSLPSGAPLICSSNKCRCGVKPFACAICSLVRRNARSAARKPATRTAAAVSIVASVIASTVGSAGSAERSAERVAPPAWRRQRSPAPSVSPMGTANRERGETGARAKYIVLRSTPSCSSLPQRRFRRWLRPLRLTARRPRQSSEASRAVSEPTASATVGISRRRTRPLPRLSLTA